MFAPLGEPDPDNPLAGKDKDDPMEFCSACGYATEFRDGVLACSGCLREVEPRVTYDEWLARRGIVMEQP